MKEFWVYTGLRLLLFLGSLGLIVALWRLVSGPPTGAGAVWVLVLSFVLSGLLSYAMLNRQREALARRVEQRAGRAVAKLDDMRSKEDEED